MLVIEPIPGGDHDIALDALGPWRLRMGQLALSDVVRPIREVADGRAAEVLDERREHLFAGLTRLDAAEPRFL
jgi:hypothetical protein